MSRNDENETIGTRIGALHGQYDADVFGITGISMKKKCKKAKWLSEEALQIAVKRRKVKGKGEKERYTV